ncbi:MAG: hypothetical protein JEY91_07190 [Spirochaetaceae bacterium]|nr:hypothetical protein [Spirochaetaceae bacterium]
MKKKYLLICIYASIVSYVFSLPVSSSSVQIDGEISVNIYTKAEMTSSSLWYGSVMPGYKIRCYYNYLNRDNQFHQFGLGITYFESNNFTANSLILEEGKMRALVLNLNGFYYRYLPILSHLDYLTGVSLSGVYNYYGKVVTEEESKINELYYIKLGPENGFSFNIRDLFELRSVLSLYAGIPVSGMIYYPGGNEESVSPVTLGIKINTELSFNIKKNLSIFKLPVV